MNTNQPIVSVVRPEKPTFTPRQGSMSPASVGAGGSSRDVRQAMSADWAVRMFGPNTMNVSERAGRFIEEALELVQSVGMEQADVERLVAYVYSREKGQPAQEIGGVGTTLLTLAQALGVSADAEEERELRRVLSKSAEHFRARHAKKVEQGVAQASSL